MSLAKRKMPPVGVVAVDLKRRTSSQNATTGAPTFTDSDVASAVRGSLQPVSGSTDVSALSGGLATEASHVFYAEERITGVVDQDLLIASSTRYRVVWVRDFGAPAPQDLYLLRLSSVGESV